MNKKNITKEELLEVKKIDLLTYLTNYEPSELIKYSYNDYGTRTHSSLHIANGIWRYYAEGVYGRSALDYLIKVENMKFLDAALFIHSFISHTPPTIVEIPSNGVRPKGTLKLPLHHDDNNQIINYLVNQRFIDKEIVEYYIEKKMIYEAKYDHSIIFVGYNIFEEPRFASKRSINTDERRNISGSNKNFAFSVVDKLSTELYVGESPIEIASNQTLMKLNGQDWRKGNHLSLDGATVIGEHGIENSQLPIALSSFLSRNEHIDTIHVCTNNDKAGRETLQKIQYHLSDCYTILDGIPKTDNDLNDILRATKKMKHRQIER